MDKQLKSLEDISLSNDEVLKLVDGQANLIQYPQLLRINHIDEILNPYGACIVLYLTKENYGHWTAIFKLNKNTLEWFDPYGLQPDEEQYFKMDPKFRKKVGQDYPHLLELLYNSGYNITYNQHQFQAHKSDVKTCGRHTAVRLMCRDMSLKKYYKMMHSTKYTPDQLVTLITEAKMLE